MILKQASRRVSQRADSPAGVTGPPFGVILDDIDYKKTHFQ